MEITKTLYARNRNEFRKWLEKNHDKEKDIWLVYYKKHTRKETISYNDAVEEAICFCWIDTTVKSLNDSEYAQRFTSRKNHFKWSEPNIKRAKKMIEMSKMKKFALAKFNEYMKSGIKSDKRLVDPKTKMRFEKFLKKNRQALELYKKLAPSYQKNFLRYIGTAKQDATKMKRMRLCVSHLLNTKKNPYNM